MKLKTYHATSVDAALKLARIELGEEALFLGADQASEEGDQRFRATFAVAEEGDSPDAAAERQEVEAPYWRKTLGSLRKSPPETAVEQTAEPPSLSRAEQKQFVQAVEAAGEATAAAPAAAPAAAAEAPASPATPAPARSGEVRAAVAAALAQTVAPPSADAPFDQIRREIQELRRDLESRATHDVGPLPGGAALRFSRLAVLYDRLTARGVAPASAVELVAGLEAAAEAGESLEVLERELRRRISDAWRIADQPASDSARTMAFIGPAGAGKTTVAAKAAVRAARRGLPVRLLSVDQSRIGAVEPLDVFGELIGAPVTVVDDPAELPEAVREALRGEPEARVLIDTRAYGDEERPAGDALGEAFSRIDGLEVHYVVQPGMHPADLDRETSRYARMRPAATVFSRLDDTAAPAAIWNVYRRLGAPVSYLAEGARVPEDLRRATPALLTDWVLPQEGSS